MMNAQHRYLLVVDSDWNERFTLSMLLQRFGYTVASTNSAREGIEFLCVAPAVAVFAEADTVGAELTVLLKADPRFRDVPLVLAADSRDRSLEEKLRHGEISGLLRTPLDPGEVYHVVQQVVENGTRKSIRIPTALPAVLRYRDGETSGYVTVLSQFGLFFRTLDPRPVRERVVVDFSLWGRSVSVEAEVLYAVSFEEGPFSEPGLGMKFVKVEPEHSALITIFIYEQLGMAAAPTPPGQGPTAGSA